MKRPALVSFASLFVTSLVLLAAPRVAHADDCDAAGFTCSPVTGVSVALVNTPKFSNGLDSGWVPKCASSPNMDGHCDDKDLQAEVSADFSDSKINLSMQADYEVTWPTPNVLHIKAVPPPQGGNYSVTYKLRPTFGIYFKLDSPSIGPFSFTLDANTILSLLPSGTGVTKDFNFSASGTQVFPPFAFDKPVNVEVDGQLADVFTLPLNDLTSKIGIDIPYVNIGLNLSAGTKNTKFTWQTDSLEVQDGVAPFDHTTLEADIPYAGGSTVQATLTASGTLGYSGTTTVEPGVQISCFCTSSDADVNNCGSGCYDTSGITSFKFDVGADVPFTGNIPNTKLTGVLNIPVPQVTIPTTTIDFGKVDVGTKAKKTIKAQNFGDLTGAILSIKADNGAFSATKTMVQIPPTMPADIELDFLPIAAGPAQTKYTITSNDVANPVVVINAIGDGIAAPDPGGDDTSDDGGAGGSPPVATSGGAGGKKSSTAPTETDTDASSPSSCGCRVAGEDSSGAAALAALAGLAIFTVRRRQKKS